MLRKISIAGLLVVFLALCVAIISPYFINTTSYRDGIYKSFHDFTGLEFVAKGDLKVTLFPTPGVSIHDVAISNSQDGTFRELLTAQKIEIDCSLAKLISGDLSEINQIVIENGRLNLESFGDGKSNFDFIHDSKNNKYARIVLKNSSLSYNYKTNPLIENLSGINADLEIDPAGHKLNLAGSFNLANDTLKVKAEFNLQDLANSTIKLANKAWEFDLTPDGANNANLEFKITNIGNFLANYTNLSDSFVSQVNTDKTIDIKGNLVFNGQKMTANNVSISSESVISGMANINANYETNLSMDADITIDSINLDGLNNGNPGDKDLKRNNASNFHFVMPDNLNLLFSAGIKDVTYKSKSIKDVAISGEIFDGNLELYPSTAMLPGQMLAEIQGKVINNRVRPAFEGNFKIGGTQFSELSSWLADITGKPIGANDIQIVELKSNVSMTPREVDLYNIDFKYGTSQILGRMLIEMDKDLPTINGDINVANFDFDKYGYVLAYFISGTPKGEVQDPLSYIRNANFEFDGNFNGTDFTVFGIKFNNLTTSLAIEPASVSLKNLVMNFDNKSYSGDLGLDLRALRPSMNINIKGNILDDSVAKLDFIQNIAKKPQTDTQTTQPDRFAGTKSADNTDQTQASPAPSRWSKDRLNLLWLSNLDGAININFDKITAMGLNLTNFTWKSQFYNNALVVENFVSDLYGGKAYAKASLGFNPPAVSVTYALDTIALEQFLQSLLGYAPFNGPINVTGSFSMLGNSVFEMLSNINSTTNFSGKYIEVNNFDLSKVINAVNQFVRTPEELDAAVKASMQPGGKTMFSDVTGSIESNSGVFTLKNVQLVQKYAVGNVVGSFTLRDFMTKLAATFTFIPAREARAKTQVSYGVAIEGSLDDPKFTPELKEVRKYLSFPGAPKPASTEATPTPLPSRLRPKRLPIFLIRNKKISFLLAGGLLTTQPLKPHKVPEIINFNCKN